MLQSMGFSRSQCIKALQNTDNNVERAADWIFSHPDEINSDDFVSAEATPVNPPAVAEPTITDGPPGRKNICWCTRVLINFFFFSIRIGCLHFTYGNVNKCRPLCLPH